MIFFSELSDFDPHQYSPSIRLSDKLHVLLCLLFVRKFNTKIKGFFIYIWQLEHSLLICFSDFSDDSH